MNYYEELGLTPQASPEQIRHAYKSLARLLHPDQHGEEHLRRLAELQMKRLNGIYAVLSDPTARRAYDRSLQEAAGIEDRMRPRGVLGPRWRLSGNDLRFVGWLAGVTLLAAALFWALNEKSSPGPHAAGAGAERQAGPRAQAAPAEQDTAASLASELTLMRRRIERLEAERDAARAELAARSVKEPSASVAWSGIALPATAPDITLAEEPAAGRSGPQTEVVAESRSAAAEFAAPPQADARRSNGAGWVGNWFYARPPVGAPAGNLYPPEYIEVAITEEAGTLRGRYYGRYRVVDRAISPEVAFNFEGRAQPGEVTLEWRGGGGAKGEIRLRLLSENSMEAAWSATELGRSLGLASGTAVLVRRID